MRLRFRMPIKTAVLTLMLTAALAGTAAARESAVIGHVYVNNNTSGTNTITAFARHADGTLTPVPGSPFSAGGAGTGAPTGSQGALQLAGDGHVLLAVDAGSNQISVLAIRPDGTLRLLADGLTPSGGSEPVSIAVHGTLVYVANAGARATNYTGFRLGPDGRLRPIDGSTVALPDDSQPRDVLFNSTGTNLAGMRVGTSLIDSFSVGADGRLKAAPSSPFAAQGPGPFGSEFRPTNPSQLFVSNAHGGPGNATVSAFRVSENGTLTSIGDSPFADLQTAACWVEISRDGRFLFTVNTASQSISRYVIRQDGSLVLLGSTPERGEPGTLGSEDARLSPSGDTLWVVDTKSAEVSAFKVSGGDLTELPSSPTAVPGGGAPFGIVVN